MSTLATRKKVLTRLFKNGRATAEQLLTEAKDKRHPLHNDFEWSDTKAAHQWRLSQAREIIRSVEVIVKNTNVQIRSVAYVRDPAAPPGVQGYVSVQKLATEEGLAAEALQAEIDRVIATYQRAADFATVLNMKPELDAAIEQAVSLSTTARKRGGAGNIEDRPSP